MHGMVFSVLIYIYFVAKLEGNVTLRNVRRRHSLQLLSDSRIMMNE